LLIRGQYDKRGEMVTPGVPASFPALPPNAPNNRLGLAHWLAQPDHPLTARVAVNRWWHSFFGEGLVETVEEFGSQGAWPSHPDLLDGLAMELVQTGWDVKGLLRQIVTSSTYRQSSDVSPALLERDPHNRLLGRGPRFRLPAEAIRDGALFSAGLLVERLGGPSVKPYQPDGLWEEVSVERSQKYVPDSGEALYRRSMYTFWKRTCPPPALAAFDAPNRESCLARRSRTNTPLQSLVLMNDPTYVEAARNLAERVLTEAADDDAAHVIYAWRIVLSRHPRQAELEVLLRMLSECREHFSRNSSAADGLLAVGSSQTNQSLDRVELATWTAICNTILNLTETITKR
jgi:hypothetical protein